MQYVHPQHAVAVKELHPLCRTEAARVEAIKEVRLLYQGIAVKEVHLLCRTEAARVEALKEARLLYQGVALKEVHLLYQGVVVKEVNLLYPRGVVAGAQARNLAVEQAKAGAAVHLAVRSHV